VQLNCVSLDHNILNLSLFSCIVEMINLNQHLTYA
jgi:hypothetical protein